RRLPGYWFDSREHYFTANHGLSYAIATDLIALAAHCFGRIKRVFEGRSQFTVPHFEADLLRHSVLWPKNREKAAARKVPRFVSGDAKAAHATAGGNPSILSPIASR